MAVCSTSGRSACGYCRGFGEWSSKALHLCPLCPLHHLLSRSPLGGPNKNSLEGKYALLACLAWHDKKARDEQFIALFPVIKHGATDERNYVKKAVSWALRNIGKRNRNSNKAALEVAEEIGQMDSRAARWIAADARKELTSEAVQKKLGA